AGKPTLRRGAKVTFTLSQAATVKLTTEQLLPGRISAGKCKASKKGKRCTRTKVLHTRTVSVAAGKVEVAVPAKRLKLGKARFTVVATTASGAASAPAVAQATVKRR
ncbi:MAG: hypothetical protein JHD16_12165, partial [Solirubrobacteraceae bacterium]|nr:hypothetical protein [Solirubrobacteraceae bacterium]